MPSAALGRTTNGIGLAAISSEVYRNMHSTFQVDQHRSNRRRFMGFADRAKAVRMVSVVMSPSDIGDTYSCHRRAMTVAIASKSWR